MLNKPLIVLSDWLNQPWSWWSRERNNHVDVNNNKMCPDGEEESFQLPRSVTGTEMTDLVYPAIIALMALALGLLWLDRRRLKSGEKSRKISDMLKHPSHALPEVKHALQDVAEFVVPSKGQRFRKRDRLMFHSKRFVRRMSDNVGSLAKVSRDPSVRRRAIQRLAKNFLRYDDSSGDSSTSENAHAIVGPAEDYLEEESAASDSGHRWVPPELTYLLNSFHIFGHFDHELFFELCHEIQSIHLPAGQYLFKRGDPDEFVYVVQSGKVNVHIIENESDVIPIKDVGPGDTVTSLLSFIDCLTGNPQPFKTVCCKAITEAVVIKLPASAFADVFEKNPEMSIKVVQLIMARLQRVVFVALHQFLGLSNELVRTSSSSLSTTDEESEEIAEGLVLNNNDVNVMLEVAVRGFREELNCDNVDFLRDRVEIRNIEKGALLMTEDSHNDAALIHILSGSLIMSQNHDENKVITERTLYTAKKGECVGQLAMLTGEENFYNCKALENSCVAILSRDAFFEIVCETPSMVLSLAHNTIKLLSPLVRQVDFALDWVNIESGKAIFRQSDETDGTFIVLSGRFRSIIRRGAHQKEIVEEYSKGDMVGLVDVVTGTNRLTTVIAVRNSEVCKVPGSLLNLLKSRYPVVVSKLISLLGHRLLGTWSGNNSVQSIKTKGENSNMSYATVALFPSSTAIPLTCFALELMHSLTVVGLATRLSSNKVREKLGSSAFDSSNDYRLNAWLGQQEHMHKIVIYQCDYEMTKWTKLCLRQADVIYDLVLADKGPHVTLAEKDLEQAARRVRKELVLIHTHDTERPTGTVEFLKKRPWVSSHFHLKAPARLFMRKDDQRLQDFYFNLILAQVPNIHSDFSRLARHISGTTVGLVLGGGGARGAAHIGMLKAISEAGIPVDKVGGVSIGAFVGGLWCSSRDLSTVTQKSRSWFNLLAKARLGMVLDFTYPACSIFTGAYFNSTLYNLFGHELMIEDMWLPYFCCTTDISTSQERVHTKGIFWKYCRASMTYAWLLPPLCDPEDGHLLMDGCYVNNVPGDVMARQNCKYILAIDVTAMDDRDLTNYGDYLSGWWLLWKRLNPFASPIKIPDQSEIQLRLSFCSHHKNLEELKSNPNYEYVMPPIEKYSSGSFQLFDEIKDVGYHHGNTFFTGLRKAGEMGSLELQQQYQDHHPGLNVDLHPIHETSWASPPPGSSPPWFPAGSHYQRQWSFHRAAAARRNSGSSYTFKDLAEVVVQNLKENKSCLNLKENKSYLSLSKSNSQSRNVSLSRQSSEVPSRSSSVGKRAEGSTRRPNKNRNRDRDLSGKQRRVRQYINSSPMPQPSDDESDDTGIMI